jgi:threonine 3-dehydrogenase
LGVEQLAVGGAARLLGTSFGPARVDLSVAVMKELRFQTLHGRNDEVWPTAITMAADRTIDLPALVTHRLPLERYDEAFGLLLDGKACKVLIEISG